MYVTLNVQSTPLHIRKKFKQSSLFHPLVALFFPLFNLYCQTKTEFMGGRGT